MPLPQSLFARAAAAAAGEALGVDPSELPVTTPPRPEMGDYAVGTFPAARALGQPPPALAAKVAGAFRPTPLLAEARAAGPFVNFRADRSALYRHVFRTSLAEGASPIATAVGAGRTVCIDFSSPNISKSLAYHHIRGTVTGHALGNMYRALGYRVVGINHLGDWGTTHGQLIAAYKKWPPPADEPLTIAALNHLYVKFNQEMEADPSLAQEGRVWFARLEQGDPEARTLWQRFRDVSWSEFEEVYRELGIEFEEVKGESEFEADIPQVLALLETLGLTAISEGALVVPLDDLNVPPLLLRKQDGATLYGTRDLAAAMYRMRAYDFDRSLYVVDRGQSLHFKQLFAVLARMGFDWVARCAHVPFGVVRIGGKKTRSRAGSIVLLKEVLREATDRSRDRVREENPEMDAAALERTARAVGIGAVVFANLVTQREKDVDFEWEDVLSTKGDSGPYVQYAHARCSSVLAKGGVSSVVELAESDPAPLSGDLEWALARALTDYADAVVKATDSNEPHFVSRYLLDLCATYSRWYTSGNTDTTLRVLVDDPAARQARLALLASTRRVLADGLGLLGLEAPDAM